MDLQTWYHDLVEVRYTHVRDNNIHYLHFTRMYNMPNSIFSPPKDQALATLSFALGANCDMREAKKRFLTLIIEGPVLKTNCN